MASEPTAISAEPLDKLLSDLVDAKLEKRQPDIERLEREIGKRQARGEGAPDASPPAEHADV